MTKRERKRLRQLITAAIRAAVADNEFDLMMEKLYAIQRMAEGKGAE